MSTKPLFGQSCSTCQFSVPDNTLGNIACRRYPPQVCVVMVAVETAMGGKQMMPQALPSFPTLSETMWCGEWKKSLSLEMNQ